jgi:hypothetical protein
MVAIDNFYSDYKREILTKEGYCRAVDNIIELAKREIDLTTGQFKDLLKHKQFLENEVMGV